MHDYVLVDSYDRVLVKRKHENNGTRFFHHNHCMFRFNHCKLFDSVNAAEDYAKKKKHFGAGPALFSRWVEDCLAKDKQEQEANAKKLAECKVVSIPSPRPMLRKEGSQEWDVVTFPTFTPTHLLISDGNVYGLVGETGDMTFPYFSYEGELYCWMHDLYTYDPSEARDVTTKEQEN